MLIIKIGKNINNGRNGITKSGKLQNAWKKVNVLVYGNIETVYHQTSDDDRENKKRRTRKLLETKLSSRNLIKGINTSGRFLK